MIRFVLALSLLITLCLGVVRPALAQDSDASGGMAAMAHQVEDGITAANSGDFAAVEREVAELHATWEMVEGRVRSADPGLYGELEASLQSVDEVLGSNPQQAAAVSAALAHLGSEVQEASELLNSGAAPSAGVVTAGAVSLSQFQAGLSTVLAAAAEQSVPAAKEAVLDAVSMWPAVEGVVAAKSPDAYTAVEEQLGKMTAALRSEPVQWEAVEEATVAMQNALVPLSLEPSYTMFDAAAIVLREGLEALLVVAALLAVLRRSNNQDKQIWIWGGALMGVLLSIAGAFVLQAVFTQVSAGQNRELIEGVTSLLAAALLVYVSYWLHSKASMHGWQRYINDNTTKALARGNLIGLGLLALLAVFREGAETTVFYLGMAPAISTSDLLLGIGAGVLLLLVAAWLMLVAGVRLPLRLFFRVAGFLVFYLGFKFVGTGIHNLQVAGVLPANPIPLLPPVPALGIYPTWITLVPQLLMLAVAVLIAFYLQAQDRRMKAASAVTA